MKYFSVHYPEEVADSQTGLMEKAVFVPEGFSFWAFALGPVWFLAKRMWLVLVLYLAVQIFIAALAALELMPPAVFTVMGLGIGVIVGFEAHNLYRWTLERRHCRERTMIAGASRAEAERNFFLSAQPGFEH